MANENAIPSNAAMHPNHFVNFMRSFWGRALRVFAGVAIMYVGFATMQGTEGTIVGLIGILPVLAGVVNFCLLGPVFGVDIWGKPKT